MDALAAALRSIAPIEPPDEHTRFAPEAEAFIYQETADRVRARLAEQGYVLVNVEGLAAALRAWEPEMDWPDDGRAAARALLAHLKGDAHSA